MLSPLQAIYIIGLALCFNHRNPIWYGLIGNLVSALLVCSFIDNGTINLAEAASLFLMIDVLTAAYLSRGNGLSKIIALGYVFTAPLYVLQLQSTWAIVYLIAALQLGVLFFGSGNNGGGYFGRTYRNYLSRISSGSIGSEVSLAVPRRNMEMGLASE